MTTATVEDRPGVATGGLPPPATDDAPRAAVTATSGIAGLLPFARPARGRFALAAAISSAATVLSLVPYWAIYRTIEEVTAGGATRGELWGLAAVALAAIVARYVLFGLAIWVSHLAAYQVLYELRLRIAEHLARVPLGQVTRRRSGDLKKVMVDDVERLELFLSHGLPDMVAAAVALVAVAGWMVVVDWRMALAALVPLALAFPCLAVAYGRGGEFMGDYQRSLAAMNSSVVELIRGMPVVKVFNRGADEVRAAERAIAEHVDAVKRYSMAFMPFGTAFYVLVAANVVTLVPLGVWLWDRGSLSTPDLLFFFVVGPGALAPVSALLFLFANLSHLSSGGNLVREVLATPALDEAAAAERPADASVELRHVSFGYGDRRVLHDVSFRAEPGTVTALVGPSGAGKSTIASLVARLWDVDAGAVLVGGADVRRVRMDDLARHMAVVFQDTFLFDDTVAGNLRVAKPGATPAELEAAARAARAHGFVTALPRGYDTPLGERGARLSGGERQRLAIARAILADAPVVVLDEATAFADPDNEAAIQEAIGQLVSGKTVLTIAHRLSTVARADQVLVVEGGTITERGRHDALVAAGGTYARLWDDFLAAESTALGDAVRQGGAGAGAEAQAEAGEAAR